MERSAPGRGAVHSRKVGKTDLSTITLTYLSRSHATRIGIWEHYYATFREPFLWQPPIDPLGNGEIQVMYLVPPRGNRVGNRWNITVVLQLTL